MADKEALFSVTLNEGVTETLVEDTAGGIITRSENTRLTKRKGTLSRRPKLDSIGVGSDGVCGGLIPAPNGTVAAYFKPAHGQKRIYEAQQAELKSSLSPSVRQNAYFPYPITNADGLPGSYGCQPATTVDSNGYVWFLSVRFYSGSSSSPALFASVYDPEGRPIVSNQRMVTLSSPIFPANYQLLMWCGLTAHADGRVNAWYNTGSRFDALAMTLDLNSSVIVGGVGGTVHTPFAFNAGLAQIYHYSMADVTVDPEAPGYAYFITSSAANDASVSLLKVDASTFAVVTSTSFIGWKTAGTSDQQHYSVTAFTTPAGAPVLLVSVSDSTVGTNVAAVDTAALSVLWAKSPASFGSGRWGYVSVQPFIHAGTLYAVSAISDNLGSPLGTGQSFVFFTFINYSTGVLGNNIPCPWMKLAARPAYHKVSSEEIYPYFPLTRNWNLSAAIPAPTSFAYVTDPAITIVTPSDVSSPFTPVMRCAVDRASPKCGPQNSSSVNITNGKLLLTYAEDHPDKAYVDGLGKACRFVEFDLTPDTQPAYGFDGQVTIIGASMPAIWDGFETTEYSPLHQSKLSYTATGGLGSNLTGTFGLTAVVSWRDSAGQMRRSPPCTPVLMTLAGTKPEVVVSRPVTMRDGIRQDDFEIVLYMTLDGGSTYYAQIAEPTDKDYNGCWRFRTIPVPTADDIRLYSTGADNEPILPECPPPIWDLCVFNNRAWVIDAENRNRVLPSLLKQPRVAFEFSGNLEIIVPSTHGKLVAIENHAGGIVVFSEYGIWSIPGYGPDNSGQGGVFGEPQLISNLGCRNRESVVTVPGVGVLFQTQNGRFALLGQGIEPFDTFGIYAVGTPSVHIAEHEVIYPLKDGTGFVVYNWLAKGWTHWPTAQAIVSSTATTYATNFDGDVRSRSYLYFEGGTVSVLDSDTTDSSPSRPMLVERGWIAPEGPQGDCAIGEVWLQGLRTDDHGVRIRVSFDYQTGVSSYVEREWSAAEIAALTVSGRYTLGVNCHAKPARAVKVLCTAIPVSEVSEAFQPLGLEVTYRASGALRRRTLKAGALK